MTPKRKTPDEARIRKAAAVKNLGKVRLIHKHPLAIRWFHWVNFPILFVMIWSGLLIYWANDVYRIGIGSRTLFEFFPASFYKALGVPQRLAEGMALHFAFMWVFALNGIAYVGYLLFSGQWRCLLPKRESWREAGQVLLHDLHLRKEAPPQVKYNAAQRFAYSAVIMMGAGSLATGVAIYKPVQAGWLTPLFGGYELARFWHFWLAIGFCGFFFIHILQVLRAGYNAFRAMVTGWEIAPADSVATPAPPEDQTPDL